MLALALTFMEVFVFMRQSINCLPHQGACALLALFLVALHPITPLKAGDISQPRSFDIVAQPLDAALDAFIRSSGTQVFYENALTAGVVGREVRGQYASDVALSQLLSGTGLAAKRTDIDTFIIVPTPTSRATALAPGAASTGFMAALQHGVVDALCRSKQARPGTYRLAVELWIETGGTAKKVALVGSTGDGARDRAIQAALMGLVVGQAPPADLSQPIILTIGERSSRQSGDCAA
jgi:hypothetical protein